MYGFLKHEGGLAPHGDRAFSHPSFVKENMCLCLPIGRNTSGDRLTKEIST
jgi:hypothetical protein